MWPAKYRLPCLYTRSKSVCRNNRTLRGNLAPLPESGTSGRPSGATSLTFTIQTQITELPPIPKGSLFTEARLHRHSFASFGAPAGDHRLAALSLHPCAKSVRLRAVTPVRLERALGHRTASAPDSIGKMSASQAKSINDRSQSEQTPKTGVRISSAKFEVYVRDATTCSVDRPSPVS